MLVWKGKEKLKDDDGRAMLTVYTFHDRSYLYALYFDVGVFHEFFAYKFWWGRANAGTNFDLSTGRLAVREMQKDFDLSTGQLSR